MADNIKKTIKNDLEIVRGSTSTFFTGVDDMTNLNFDPFVSGYAYCRILDVPQWWEKDPDLKYFKDMFHKNFRSFQGVSDIELNMIQQNTGFANHEQNYVGGINRGNTQFTIGHKEYAGAVMRKLYSKWINYIRDSRTGIATYPSKFDVEYGTRNHSISLIYMVVRPDATNKTSDNVIEFAQFYSNVIATNVPLSTLYNYEQGSQDSPTIDINFNGFVEMGPDVESLALKILREDILNVSNGGDGLPFVDTLGVNADSIKILNSGMLKKIYNPDED